METTTLAPPVKIKRCVIIPREKPEPRVFVSPVKLGEAVMTLRVLKGKDVMRVVDFLIWNGDTNVTDIWINLRLKSQSAGSQHLAKLRRIGVVVDVRIGRNVFYSINQERFLSIQQAFRTFFGDPKPEES